MVFLNTTLAERVLLNRLTKECIEILGKCKVKYGKVLKIYVEYDMDDNIGGCIPESDGTFSIVLCRELVDFGKEEEIKEIILHEFCHTVENGKGHSKGWKKAVNKIRKNTGIKITKTVDFSFDEKAAA